MSAKVWFCANCGYEVNSRGRCFNCGAKLQASPLPELDSGPDDDEVGYRLDQWDDLTRGRLIQALINSGVSHRFEEEELVILAVDEAEVDRIVGRVTGTATDDDDEDDEDHAAPLTTGENVALDLYDAAKVLRTDPTDMQADVALGESSAAVFAVDFLPELDEDQLAAVGRVTRRLLGALGADEAMEDEIRHQADVLCRLLAPAAGETELAAEAARARDRLLAGAKEKGREVTLPRTPVTPGGEMGLTVTDDQDVVAGAGPTPVAAEVDRGPGQIGAGEADELADEEALPEEADEDEDTGELVYELAEWLPEQRVELSLLLESAGIAYAWDGTDLTVAEDHETEVDGLFEQVHGALDDDDEARYRSIEELFGSVDRLANDPSSEERRKAFLEAVGAVELPTPVGVDDTYWWRVRSQGRALVAAMESDARNEEVSREAALLAEMLHEMV